MRPTHPLEGSASAAGGLCLLALGLGVLSGMAEHVVLNDLHGVEVRLQVGRSPRTSDG
jgi:hypothetical protein